MFILLVNGIIYCIYGCLIYYWFENITPLSFAILFYAAPLAINAIFSLIYIKRKKMMRGKILSPVFSTINYIVLGAISQTNGLWTEFVNTYTVASNGSDGVSISIASSMISLSQIAFVILLYFGMNYLLAAILLKNGGKGRNEYIKDK